MRHRLSRSAVPALVLAAGLAFSSPALACMGGMAATDPGSAAATSTDTGTATAALATDTTAVTPDTTSTTPAAATSTPPTAPGPAGPRHLPATWMQHFSAAFSHLLASVTQAMHTLIFVHPSL